MALFTDDPGVEPNQSGLQRSTASFDAVVLDTNIIEADPGLTGIGFEYLKAFAATRNATIAVPAVVRSELLDHAASHGKDLAIQYNRLRRDMARYGVGAGLAVNSGGPVFEQVWEESAVRHMHARLAWLGATILPLPEVSHREVIDRLLKGLKPFGRKERDVGYRDYLLWLSVLEAGRSIAFITANSRDFGADGLEEELRRDCVARGIQVQMFSSLQQFTTAVAEQITPVDALDVLLRRRDVLDRLTRFAEGHANLSYVEEELDDEDFQEFAVELLRDRYPEHRIEPADVVVFDASIAWLDQIALRHFTTLRQLEDGRVAAEFDGDVIFGIEVKASLFGAGEALEFSTERSAIIGIVLEFDGTNVEPIGEATVIT